MSTFKNGSKPFLKVLNPSFAYITGLELSWKERHRPKHELPARWWSRTVFTGQVTFSAPDSSEKFTYGPHLLTISLPLFSYS